jgi:hypothetical protein
MLGKMTEGSDMFVFLAVLLQAAALAQTPWEAKLRFTHDPPRKDGAPDGSIHVKGKKVRIEEATSGGTLVIVFDGVHLRLLRPERKTYVELPAAQAPYATVPPASLEGLRKVGEGSAAGKACGIWEARSETPFGKVQQRVWVANDARDYVYLRAVTRTSRGASLFEVVAPRRTPQPDSLFEVPRDYSKN